MRPAFFYRNRIPFFIVLLFFALVSPVSGHGQGYVYGSDTFPTPQAACQAYIDYYFRQNDSASKKESGGAKETHTGTPIQQSARWYGIRIVRTREFENDSDKTTTMADSVIEVVSLFRPPVSAAIAAPKEEEKTIEVKRGNKITGRFTRGKQLEIIDTTSLYGGNTITLDPDKTTTVTGTLQAVNIVGARGINSNKSFNGATAAGTPNKGGINILRSPQWNEIQETFTATITKVTRTQPTKANPTRPVTADTSHATLKDWDEIPGEFWEKVNKPWLDAAISRNDRFRFVSDPRDVTAIYRMPQAGKPFLGPDKKPIRTIFGKEIEYLQSKGYRILADGTAVR